MWTKKNNPKFLQMLKTLGENIQKTRTTQNITLEQLSQKTEISINYLKKIEQGTAIGISATQLFKLAKALQKSPGLLLKNN